MDMKTWLNMHGFDIKAMSQNDIEALIDHHYPGGCAAFCDASHTT
jgi:hypothetical protein